MTAPVVRHYSNDPGFDNYELPIQDATTIKPGWFLSLEGGYLVALDAVTEDATFAGIALTGHAQNLDTRVTVSFSEKCVVEVDTVAAAYLRGAALKFSTGSGDSIIMVADADANTLVFAAETKTTTAADLRLKVLVDVPRLAQNANKLHDTVSA